MQGARKKKNSEYRDNETAILSSKYGGRKIRKGGIRVKLNLEDVIWGTIYNNFSKRSNI